MSESFEDRTVKALQDAVDESLALLTVMLSDDKTSREDKTKIAMFLLKFAFGDEEQS